jgi:hypothetical protein
MSTVAIAVDLAKNVELGEEVGFLEQRIEEVVAELTRITKAEPRLQVLLTIPGRRRADAHGWRHG